MVMRQPDLFKTGNGKSKEAFLLDAHKRIWWLIHDSLPPVVDKRSAIMPLLMLETGASDGSTMLRQLIYGFHAYVDDSMVVCANAQSASSSRCSCSLAQASTIAWIAAGSANRWVWPN